MSLFYITPNQTTITTLYSGSAFCYVSIRDDEGNISGENIATNILNFLGYIPLISIISGLARKIFAEKMLENTSSEEAIKHYKNHADRALVEMVPIYGNLGCLGNDLINAFFSLGNAFKDNIEAPYPVEIHDFRKL